LNFFIVRYGISDVFPDDFPCCWIYWLIYRRPKTDCTSHWATNCDRIPTQGATVLRTASKWWKRCPIVTSISM
jgi:hypothetical protein